MVYTANTTYAATLLRASLGIMFIAHAWLKISVFTPAGTAQYFESLGLPSALAYLTIFAELIGGILLVIGFKTREVSLALIPILLGAVWVHSGNGWLFSGTGGGWEFPLFWTATLGVQALLGNGAFAVRWLSTKA